MRFTCSTCGEVHDLAEISFSANEPALWLVLTEKERQQSRLSPEQCVIVADDRTSYYIHACLNIPIRGTDQEFTWGVWCSLSERSFEEMRDHWDDPQRTRRGPYFGWLCTPVPSYPDTMFLKSMVHQREIGLRPLVELEPTKHPLSVHQRNGIEAEPLQHIVMKLLHGTEGA